MFDLHRKQWNVKKTYEFIPAPTISISIAFEDLNGKQYKTKFTLESTFIYFTDSVITESDSLSKKKIVFDSLRGRLRFKLK